MVSHGEVHSSDGTESVQAHIDQATPRLRHSKHGITPADFHFDLIYLL